MSTDRPDQAPGDTLEDDLLFEETFDPADLAGLAALQPLSVPKQAGEDAGKGAKSQWKASLIDFSSFHRDFPEPWTALHWPLFAWRVAATLRERRSFDFLQLASLRLSLAGVWAAADQAKLLCLHRELLERVMTDLLGRGLLDGTGRLTELGQQALERGGEEEEATRWGWVLQDALTDELLPFLHVGRLPFRRRQETETSRCIELPRLIEQPRRPPPLKLARAYQQWTGLVQAAEEERSQLEQTADAGPDVGAVAGAVAGADACFPPPDGSTAQELEVTTMAELEAQRAPSLRLLEERPQPLSLRVWIDLRGMEDSSFVLRSPLQLPDSHRWTRLLHFAASQSGDVQAIVSRLKAASLSAWQARQPAHIDPTHLAREAYDLLVDRFGAALQPPRWKRLWGELEPFARSRLLVRKGFDETDTLLTRAQRVLERLLLIWLELDMPPRSLLMRYQRPGDLERVLRDAAVACGADDSRIPPLLVQVKLGSLRSVLEGKGLSLRPYAAALLLGASRRPSVHAWTLREVLLELPDFLNRIDAVAEARNRFGAHAGLDSRNSKEKVDEVCEHVTACVRVVLRTLNGTIH